MPKSLAYRPEIDGLRAVAVIAVLVFHLNNDWLAGGFLGVDVFFVISGYLITSIIYPQISGGTFSLVQFWKRRIMRLYPAMIIMVSAVLIVGSFLLLEPERSDLPLQAVAAVLSFENILLWLSRDGYWGRNDIALLHAWSLSLEEQFYITFPLALLLIRRLSGNFVIAFVVAGAAASLALCVYGTFHHPDPTFFLLPTRVWELLLGSLLSIIQHHHPRRLENTSLRWPNFFSLLGLALIVSSYFLISHNQYFPSVLPMVPCLGTILLIVYGGRAALCQKLLAGRPVVYVGKISYSLYLWHYPVIVFAGFLFVEPNPIALIVLSFVLASLSYHFVEQPFRYNISRKRLYAPIVFPAILLVSFTVFFSIPKSPVFSKLGNTQREGPYETSAQSYNIRRAYRKGLPLGTTMSGKGAPFDICATGSSHVGVHCPAIADYAKTHGYSALSLACHGIEITTRKPGFYRQHTAALHQAKPRIIIVGGRWLGRMGQSQFAENLKEELLSYSSLAEHVFVLSQAPQIVPPAHYKGGLIKYAAAYWRERGHLPPLSLMDTDTSNSVVKNVVDSINRDNVTFIDIAPLFLNEDGTVNLIQEGNFLYSDSHHISGFGAELVFSTLLEQPINALLSQEKNSSPASPDEKTNSPPESRQP